MSEQETGLNLSATECRQIICRFVDAEIKALALEMITPENLEQVFKNGLENLRNVRKQSNEVLKNMTVPELVREQQQQRHSRQHKIICAINGAEDGRAFLERISQIKKPETAVIEKFLKRHIEMSDLLTELFKIDIFQRTAQIKKEPAFSEAGIKMLLRSCVKK
ncbi:MAG: hypothetical protein UX09_C0057G0001 [Candidatus Uhrbacteria bacterium GW2011_GWE2_45_35]|uniref:Uncharacterized protein n=2 Tax=Candidatus Uhriibacteriota TaxID=1752732 RepID=A0A0G1MDX1_9BACT|nr:MAG: hypothetical protein UW63_C0036G0010 [Candidatus Uhrbacteria bacterium GW2011_GWF2_44_350]KKU06161.1 MAG: hypothetical protein UX09_C0057G0001 [Candidatus Uhrbacteria bacterium GW2011_GWE2_45_35]